MVTRYGYGYQRLNKSAVVRWYN